MQREIVELCTKKCIIKNDIKTSEELSIPQMSCFHRCTIKFQEAMRFTQDTLNFQTYEINKINKESRPEEQPSLMERLHAIYEQEYGKSAQPVPFVKK